MNPVRKIDVFLGKCASALLIVLLAVMVLMGFTQVMLRNIFSTGILWADVFLRHTVLWIGFLGAIVAAGEKRHITIDALTKLLSPRQQRIASVITGIASVTVCYFLTSASLRFLKDEMEFGGTLILDLPIWIFQVIIPAGFGLMMVRFAVHTLDSAVSLFQSVEPSGETGNGND